MLSFMFGRGELIAISSDTTSAKDALVLLLTRQIEPTSGKISWNAKGGAHSLISYEDHLLYKHFINAKISTLFYAGIGYFPQDVSRLIFPDLNYFENTTIFSLRRISYLGTVVRSAFQNYLLTKQPFSYKEDPKHPFYKINYENRIVAMVNRYALYNWRLLIIHLPNINPTGVEAKIFQTLINELANRGTSVLVVVAASSEILTRADNLFEFDQEGNCYQKLDHQNHR